MKKSFVSVSRLLFYAWCAVVAGSFSPLCGIQGLSTFVARSQGNDAVFDMRSWIRYIESACEDGRPVLLMSEFKASHSFNSGHIRDYLFGSSPVVFAGSRVNARSNKAILADYFGLPSDFEGAITATPEIRSFMVNVAAYVPLYCYERSRGGTVDVYAQFHAPLVSTKYALRLAETISAPGKNFHPAGYMGKGDLRIPRDRLAPNVASFLKGGLLVGDFLEPLRYGKIDGARTKTGLADFHIMLGCHLQSHRNNHLSIYGHVGVPTGGRVSPEYLFDPQLGCNNHWQVGAGLQGYVVCSLDQQSEREIGLMASLALNHACTTQQRRSFDITSAGTGSRYALIELMGPAVDDIVQIPAGSTLKTQYQGLVLPALHVTTMSCKIRVNIITDVVLGLSLKTPTCRLDAGYNLWMRSKETLVSRDILPADRYALKGDASLYGFENVAPRYYVPLNATQSMATITAGQGTGNTTFANLNADNVAANGTGLASLVSADSVSLRIPIDLAGGSNQPILLRDRDINNQSGLAPRAITHKFFVQGSYSLHACRPVAGHIGLGAEIECAAQHAGVHAAAAQWGVWAYAGLCY